MDVRIAWVQLEGLAVLRDRRLENTLLVVGRTQVEPHAHVLRGQLDRFAILTDGHVEPIQCVQGLAVELEQAVVWSGRYPVPRHSVDLEVPSVIAHSFPKYEALARRLVSLY